MKLVALTLIAVLAQANIASAKGLYCHQNSSVKLDCSVYTYSKTGKQIRYQSSHSEMEDLNADEPSLSSCAASLSFVVSDGRSVSAQMGEDLKLAVYELTQYGFQSLGSTQMVPGKSFRLSNQPLNNGWSFTMTCELN